MSVLRNLAWVRNGLSVTMTDAFASDASVWNARVTCYVVLEKRDRAIKLHKLSGTPRKLWRPFEKVRWGGHGPPGPPCQAATACDVQFGSLVWCYHRAGGGGALGERAPPRFCSKQRSALFILRKCPFCDI